MTDSKPQLKPNILGNDHTNKSTELKNLPQLFDASYTARWLIFRQTAMLEAAEIESSEPSVENFNFNTDNSQKQSLSGKSTNTLMENEFCINQIAAGFNGRCNKVADTCYAFWVGASLAVGLSQANTQLYCRSSSILKF